MNLTAYYFLNRKSLVVGENVSVLEVFVGIVHVVLNLEYSAEVGKIRTRANTSVCRVGTIRQCAKYGELVRVN